MTAIDRTVYPRPGALLTRDELSARCDLAESEVAFIRANARGDAGRLMLATLLKTRQDLGCFTKPEEAHPATVAHLASQLGLHGPPGWPDEARRTKSLYRYQAAVRAHLSIRPYDESAEGVVSNATRKSAETMSDPADLINRAVEALQAAAIDLPAFSTLDRLVNSVRTEVHARICKQVSVRLTADDKAVLDGLLAKPPNSVTTSFNRLKQTPGPATPKTIRLWIERLEWLTGLIDPEPLLEGVTHTKLRQFASEATALEVNELLDISRPGRRHTMLLSLLRQARMRCRDELIEMMLRRIRRTQAAAKERLEELHDQHREIEEALIGILGQVLETAQAQEADAAFGHKVKQLLAEQGGIEVLAEQYETVSAWHHKNDLPLLWPIHAKYRSLLFQLIEAAQLVDDGFADNGELSIDPDGTPHLKQLVTKERPDGLAEFEQEVRARMPEHHLLDILKNAEHWARFTRHFGPPSGSDPKLAQAVQRYLFTVFGYGCNLGPNQTARHAPEIATAQALRRINAQHINAEKLEAAMVDVIGEYVRFQLPRHWGSGRTAIADGTHVKLRENNLLGSRHIRYGGYGGIAYHHIADTYIALFTSFITCGVWEAVHILDALLKNRSEIQPDTLHADTQGQSEPVFGLCRLLGIGLMPRMRGLTQL
jgi:hypothetical protein